MGTNSSAMLTNWVKQPEWLFCCGSVFAAIVALIADGPGSFVGGILLALCVATICCWSIKGIPSLEGSIALVSIFILLLGWVVEDPQSSLFQPILLAIAIGWRVERLSRSLAYLAIVASLPLVGSLGAGNDSWAWWNWMVGTIFTWTLGRIIRLLEQTLDELTTARTRLVEMAAREERRRISADVHDLVGHSMTAVLLNIRAAQQSLTSAPTDASKALADAEEVARLGIADIRDTLLKLRSAECSEAGINDDQPSDTLTSLPDGESIHSLLSRQVHITVNVDGDIESLQGPVAVSLYRILQECITNISKHAVSASGKLELSLRSDSIILISENEIANNRRGKFDLSDRSLGIISIRERVASLGGTFTAGVKNDCWQVHIRIPLND